MRCTSVHIGVAAVLFVAVLASCKNSGQNAVGPSRTPLPENMPEKTDGPPNPFDQFIEHEKSLLDSKPFPDDPGAARMILAELLRINRALNERHQHPLYVREQSRKQAGDRSMIELDFYHESVGAFSGRLNLPGTPGVGILRMRNAGSESASGPSIDEQGFESKTMDACPVRGESGPVLEVFFKELLTAETAEKFAIEALAHGTTKMGLQLLAATLGLDYLETLTQTTPCMLRIEGSGAGEFCAKILMLLDERARELVLGGLQIAPAGSPKDYYDLNIPGSLRLVGLRDTNLIVELLQGRGYCVRDQSVNGRLARVEIPESFFPCGYGKCGELRKARGAKDQCPGVPRPAPMTKSPFPSSAKKAKSGDVTEGMTPADREAARRALKTDLRLKDSDLGSISVSGLPRVKMDDGRAYELSGPGRPGNGEAILMLRGGGADPDIARRLSLEGFDVYLTELPLSNLKNEREEAAARVLEIDRTLGGLYTLQVLEIIEWLKGQRRSIIVMGSGKTAPVARYAGVLSDGVMVLTEHEDGELTRTFGWAAGPMAFQQKTLESMIVPPDEEIKKRIMAAVMKGEN